MTPRGKTLHWLSSHRGITEQPAGSNTDQRKDGIRAAQLRSAGGASVLIRAPWCGTWAGRGLLAGVVKGVRISGKDPKLGGAPGGALGYSVYLRGDDGKTYFLTHIDRVRPKVGARVRQGQKIAVVANGPSSWSTPHVHMGVKG